MVMAIKNYGGAINIAHTMPDELQRFFGVTDTDTISVDEAYETSGWFRNGIDHRANAFSNLPFDILNGDEVIANENDFENRLPPELNIFRILDDLIVDLDLHGAAYAVLEENKWGGNRAWRRLHPLSMKPVFDAATGLKGFKRRVNNQERFIAVDEPRFFYLWMPSRKDELLPGPGVGQTALLAASVLAYTDQFQNKFFKQGAINPTLVNIEGFETFPDDEKDEARNLFQRIMGGIRNAWRVIPLGGKVSVTSLIQPLKDLSMAEMTDKQRESISTTLGVPQTIMFSNAANFAVAKQDNINFYDKTIVPFARRVIEMQLNERFFRRLGLRLKYRPERLEVFQEIEADKISHLVLLFDRAIISEDEVREQLGMEPVEAMDRVPERLLAPEREDDDGLPAFDLTVRSHLAKWERKALKRFEEGTPEKALEFESDAISPLQMEAIAGALDVAQSADDVKVIFDEARRTAVMWEY